jgi:mannitol-1-phosphate 5-dehydrogenase
MSLTGNRTFVGFGFGPIQAGLFLYEAYVAGVFGRLVVAEVVPAIVADVRANGGYFRLNIAHSDRIETVAIGPITILDPGVPEDRHTLIEAVAEADEIATAVPSVAAYTGPGPDALHRILAAGLQAKLTRGGPRAVVYTAENHNHAAEILAAAVSAELSSAEQAALPNRVCFLNTVIGKMSGVVTDPAEIATWGLAPVTPTSPRAFLVEAFNRILISRVRFADGEGFERGLSVFSEKDELLPFEEAKLYGHNATHALAAYLGALAGLRFIAELVDLPGAMEVLRRAFLDESGAALCRKYAGRDPLFTPAGYAAYAEDLLVRMTNPHLHDTVARVGRDPQRKLGWDDRLIGTMRLAWSQGILPRYYAVGAAAALAVLDPAALTDPAMAATHLRAIWPTNAPPAEQEAMLALVEQGRQTLLSWRRNGGLSISL